MKRGFSIIFLISCSIASVGCSSFSNKGLKRETVELNENNIYQLNGTYFNYASAYYNEKIYPDSIAKKVNAYNLITANPIKLTRLDSLDLASSTDSFSLRFIDTNQIEIKYFIGGRTLYTEIIPGKIKKGFFYLDNKFYKRNGIPFIWGGIITEKKRIGISEDNYLIVNTIYKSKGALLLFLLGGSESKAVYKIEKIPLTEKL